MTRVHIPAPLRQLVSERAHGCCEYCLVPEIVALAAHQVDHTGDLVLLYNPRRDRWADHFRLIGAQIVPLTPVGRATVRLLRLNVPERLAERELLLASGALHEPL